MVTIHRQHGLRVVIFVDDHEPAHVHFFGDGEAKINLIGIGGQPELLWSEGMNRVEVRKAMRIEVEKQLHFLQRWQEIHG